MASKIDLLIQKGKTDNALIAVANFTILLSNTVYLSGSNKTIIKGMVLHVAKSKKVLISKSLGDKIKKEIPYHRLVFCR